MPNGTEAEASLHILALQLRVLGLAKQNQFKAILVVNQALDIVSIIIPGLNPGLYA